jgi:hypothetical protein
MAHAELVGSQATDHTQAIQLFASAKEALLTASSAQLPTHVPVELDIEVKLPDDGLMEAIAAHGQVVKETFGRAGLVLA